MRVDLKHVPWEAVGGRLNNVRVAWVGKRNKSSEFKRRASFREYFGKSWRSKDLVEALTQAFDKTVGFTHGGGIGIDAKTTTLIMRQQDKHCCATRQRAEAEEVRNSGSGDVDRST
eukprot:gene5410-6902_t